MRRLVPMLIALGLLGPPVGAVSFYFTPDVPTDDPSGATASIFLPWEVVRNDSGAYSVVLAFPAGTAVDGLHRMCNGDWLFSVEAPAILGGNLYDPRDVIRCDPTASSFSLYFGGAAAGVPAGVDVDAAYLDGGDTAPLILSFDVPARIGAAVFDPADLVRRTALGFALHFDASSASPPIPLAANVAGADRRGGLTILTFDTPVTLAPPTYLPGELVSWDGTVFSSFHADPGWPISSGVNAWSFLPDPGEVPSILVSKSMLVPGNLSIQWSPSSSAGAEDYGIYEGSIGTWYSHTAIDCSDSGGDLVEEVTPAAGARYYLVVALNSDVEGSYGRDSTGAERPVGFPAACRAAQGFDCP